MLTQGNYQLGTLCTYVEYVSSIICHTTLTVVRLSSVVINLIKYISYYTVVSGSIGHQQQHQSAIYSVFQKYYTCKYRVQHNTQLILLYIFVFSKRSLYTTCLKQRITMDIPDYEINRDLKLFYNISYIDNAFDVLCNNSACKWPLSTELPCQCTQRIHLCITSIIYIYILIQHDNGASTIKCKQGSQL